ncbi:S-adenosyl-L-methionine-dependent methyltransferase superfamily protein [Pleurotus pulmonarius]
MTEQLSLDIPEGVGEQVFDADEEVFLLYSTLQSSSPSAPGDPFRGLGHVDSKTDTLIVKIELTAPLSSKSGSTTTSGSAKESARKHHKKATSKNATRPDISLEVELWQDKTALRSRKGDTGSVLWKASVDFAQTILQELYFGNTSDRPNLLDPERLKASHVLELGAGTGLLSILLSPFVKHYTATDIEALIPLIRKNISSNTNDPVHANLPSSIKTAAHQHPSHISTQALDWLDLHALASPTLRTKYISAVSPEPVDLLLIVDCIYNPSLLPALVSTIDTLAIPERTVALVIVELRAEDVIREFLTLWLALDSWVIRRREGFLKGPYAVWTGVKTR